MADECIFCPGGFVVCDGDPDCGLNKDHGSLIGGGWKHKGCFCVGCNGDGVPELVDCSSDDAGLTLAIYTKGNKVAVIPVLVCPPNE